MKTLLKAAVNNDFEIDLKKLKWLLQKIFNLTKTVQNEIQAPLQTISYRANFERLIVGYKNYKVSFKVNRRRKNSL